MIDVTAHSEYAYVYDATGGGQVGAALARWALPLLPPGGRVLDVACGAGAATLLFAAAGLRALGIDHDAALLALAEAKARDAHLDVRFQHGDLRTFAQAAPAAFDAACCFDALHILAADTDPARLFGAVAGQLRHGGALLFDSFASHDGAAWDWRDDLLHDHGGYLLYRRCSYDDETDLTTAQYGWLVRETDRWWRGTHTEQWRLWPPTMIYAALMAAGFVDISATPLPAREARLAWIARKA